MGDLQSEDITIDLFNKLIADTTNNESNLASHYPYSPERWRLFKGSNASGNRLFPEYDTVSEYNHRGDVHELKPASGETIIFESAERYRYVVQYEILATWAFQINQELQSGDHIRVGLYDGDDGWFLEKNGDHADYKVDLVMLRDGSEVYRKEREVSRKLIYKTRMGLFTAWYDVSRQFWIQSYSAEHGIQQNKEIDKVASKKDENGPKKGNVNLRYEVKASNSTNGLVLEAGSSALVTLGSGADNFRSKSAYFNDNVGSTNVWVPIRAFREIPEKKVINNQLLSLVALSHTGGDRITLTAQCFDETNVTFTDSDSWSTPDSWQRQNNALETRNDVDQVADNSGNLATNPDDPGGFQTGHTVLDPTEGTQFQKGASEADIGVKRNIPDGDIAVVMAETGATGDVGYVTNFEQDW